MPSTPQFSIDLDAELSKISQRQHLNDVHYLVALVRHGLTHGPHQIEILSQKKQLQFHQDGASIDGEEWAIICQLLFRQDSGEEEQQRALELLETVYGIALLSIFLNFERVTLISGDRCIQKSQGRVTITTPSQSIAGYQIKIERPRLHREKEHTELCFYCAGAKVPILYNRKTINTPLKLNRQLLALDFKTEEGQGCVAIPTSGELSRFYFFKAGIRVGVKTATPVGGRIIEGFWNADSPRFESLYQQTIHSGQPLLEAHTKALYRAIPDHFSSLPPAYQDRLKKILMGMDPLGWAEEFGRVRLFANALQNHVLSIKDLMRLQKNFESLPFLTKPHSQAPPFLPVLTGEDQYFLGHQLNMRLMPFLGQNPSKKPSQKQTQTIPNHVAVKGDGQWEVFLSELNNHNLPIEFTLTQNASHSNTRANGVRQVWLNREDERVTSAFAAFCQRGASAHWWRYWLLREIDNGS